MISKGGGMAWLGIALTKKKPAMMAHFIACTVSPPSKIDLIVPW
jgi:hypothetical protein